MMKIKQAATFTWGIAWASVLNTVLGGLAGVCGSCGWVGLCEVLVGLFMATFQMQKLDYASLSAVFVE